MNHFPPSRVFKGRLNTDTLPQNFWTTFLENDLTEQLKKSAVANAIAKPLLLCYSSFVLLIRRFRENLTKPFYFYLSRPRDSPGGTPSVINLALSWETERSRTEPSLENRVDEESIWSPVRVFLPLRLRRCEPVRCPSWPFFFVARFSNGKIVLCIVRPCYSFTLFQVIHEDYFLGILK